MTVPICLLVRNKPCKIDAFEIAKRHSCAFVGYSAIREQKLRETLSVLERVLPFDAPEAEWCALGNVSARTQRHRNYLNKLAIDQSVLVMPRMVEGKLYLGRYRGYEIHRQPIWLQEFRDMCADYPDISEESRDSSICHVFKVDRWRAVPFTGVPAWIRKSVFGQDGIQQISDVGSLSALDELTRLLTEQPQTQWTPTTDAAEVKNRMLNLLSPSAFEHLMVSLLQLEQPDVRWVHVGGSGDGGVDGLGVQNGETNAILQCKWQYDGRPVKAETSGVQLYIATLFGERQTESPSHIKFFGSDEVAELVLKHAERLPFALTLGVRSHEAD